MIQDAVKVLSNGIASNSLYCDPDPSVSVPGHISILWTQTSVLCNQEQNKIPQRCWLWSSSAKKSLDSWGVYFLLEWTVILHTSLIYWQLFIFEEDNKCKWCLISLMIHQKRKKNCRNPQNIWGWNSGSYEFSVLFSADPRWDKNRV